MRYPAALFATLVLAACGSAAAARVDPQAASPAVVQFLLASAAKDFHAHGPAGPVRFRKVRIGHVKISSGEEQYMMCGEFLPTQEAGQAEWTPFVTIKMSDYEQYVGETTYCQRPGTVWDAGHGDLATVLQSRLDTL
jgi:hypothetical protein